MGNSATIQDQLETTFRAAIDAYTAQDADALLSLFTEDGVIQDMADPDNFSKGQDAMRIFLADYFGALEDVQVELSSVAVGDNVVSAEVDVHANWVAAPFSSERPKAVHLSYCVVDAFRDGKIWRERYYWDTSILQRQLDA